MPAARDTDWMHVYVDGDPAAGRAYMSYARKLMGFVRQQASVAGLGTYSRAMRLEDGTVIVAQVHGDQRKVLIRPSPIVGRKPVAPFRDFVAGIAGSAGEPIILRPDNGQSPDADGITPYTGQAAWKSYFLNSDEPGYSTAADVGTYIGAYPLGLFHFPSDTDASLRGLRWTTCWRNARGECLSIVNGGNRYWPHKYYHPYLLYHSFVAHVGHLCLDLYNYVPSGASIRDTTPHILGAAFRDGRLFVMMASLGAITYPAPPDAPSGQGDTWVSPIFAKDSFTYRLYRFDLIEHEDPVSGVHYYAAANKSEKLLTQFSNSAECALYAPWVFNEGVTQAVTYSLPHDAVQGVKAIYSDDYFATSPDWGISPGFNGTGAYRVAVSISEDGESASVSTASSGTAVAESCSGKKLHFVPLGGGNFAYDFDGASIPAVTFNGSGLNVGDNYTICTLLDADLDFGVLMLFEYAYTRTSETASVQGGFSIQRQLRMYRAGVEAQASGVDSYTGRNADMVTSHRWFDTLFGMPGLTAFYAQSMTCVWAYDKGQSSSSSGRGLFGFTVGARRHVCNSPAAAKWCTTGGGLSAPGDDQTYWDAHYMGAGGLDMYSGAQPTALQYYDVFAANNVAEIGNAADVTGPIASPGSGLVATSSPSESSLVGTGNTISALSLLGRPPITQPLEVAA